ncbi:phosphatidate cytidylyltransferase, mitochondrial [Sitophilus oryzae]|uniref:Phosphatidate cytidylyltransferase, mitochondrial n=1 Tax=Sitophilus oryzae TaxID=7048 RepID=A0A6J2Y5A3_SITOR|nr:phosphatidate cytidylyltransferase, mitochondrial [Sitophilus oryzae]
MIPTKLVIVPPIYKRIMAKFPQNFTFCFAYGSGVKKQLLNGDKQNMIDLIFAVKDPVTWHEANMNLNPSHYSGIKYLGHEFISQYQRNFGAKVYFNTLVPMDEYWIKYGVVANSDLVTDLLEWSYLYLAGRLHKPVEIVKKPLDTELETALQLNLQSAVHAALLILPDTFTEYEFYHTISNLSYLGDFRMVFGEQKNKVENIVKAQMLGFRNLYKPFLTNLQDYVDFPMIKDVNINQQNNLENTSNLVENCISDFNCAQDVSPLAKLHHLNQLPRWPQKALTRYWNKGNFRQDTEDVLRAIAYDPDCGTIVSQRINEIVWKSSVRQSIKGILTAGLFKSIKYSSRKVKKMLN